MRTSSEDGTAPGEAPGHPLTKPEFEALAAFRFAIRSYLRFSEQTVRAHGITPQQYQLMLALKGFPGREWATVTELAERLQLRHHTVVELVDRAARQDLVARTPDPDDARAVRIVLADAGERALGLLSALHRDELARMSGALTPPRLPRPGDDVPREPAPGAAPAATGGGDDVQGVRL